MIYEVHVRNSFGELTKQSEWNSVEEAITQAQMMGGEVIGVGGIDFRYASDSELGEINAKSLEDALCIYQFKFGVPDFGWLEDVDGYRYDMSMDYSD